MSQGQQPVKTGRRWKFSAVYVVQLAAIGVGLVGTIVYALAGPVASWTTLAAAVMIAAAALGTGGLVGILFGVPRTAAGQPTAPIPGISANTNLEQISDWLTKILVGVTLVQFGAIKREAGDLFEQLAPALGGADGATAFAGSVVVYFLVIGFLTGWLYARLRLGVAMSTADSLSELARRADRAGDTQTAEAARNAAAGLIDLARHTGRLDNTPPDPTPTTPERAARETTVQPPPDRPPPDQPDPPGEDPGFAPPGGERPEADQQAR